MDAGETFAWLDRIADDCDLLPNAARLAIILRRYFNSKSGGAWPSQATLCDVTGLSRSSVQKAFRALIERGHLSVEVHRGRGSTNIYRPVVANKNAFEREHIIAQNARDREQGVHANESTNARDHDHEMPAIASRELLDRTLRENSLSELNASHAADVRENRGRDHHRDDDDAFAEFWRTYPRRVSKGSARRAWSAALKKATAEQIIDGARRYAGATARSDPKFIKHPATWLNGECWLDELAPAGISTIDQDGNVVDQPHRGDRQRMSQSELIDSWADDITAGRYSAPW